APGSVGPTASATSTGTGGASPGAAPKSTATSTRTGGALSGRKPKPKRKQVPRTVKPRTAKPVEPVEPAPTVDGVFPLTGPFSFGGEDALFGAGRTGHIHQGQDVTAARGTPIVAPVAGTVIWKKNQPGGAGIYLVVHGADERDYVFMHIKRGTVVVAVGDAVTQGQQLAQVGATGDASGPHLHFEIWVGGWYAKGGAPIDPLPQLQRWAGLPAAS
ncbi:MAG: M23 family metallopeptidase, partial [Conexibacter sp.]